MDWLRQGNPFFKEFATQHDCNKFINWTRRSCIREGINITVKVFLGLQVVDVKQQTYIVKIDPTEQ